MSGSSHPALELRGLEKKFGSLVVTRDVSLSLHPGARHALIGPNGAGKSTLVNIVTGALKPNQGHILIDGRDVTSLSPEKRVKLGLARTFQINSLFLKLTVAENIGQALSAHRGLDGSLGRPLQSRSDFVGEVEAVLRMLGLIDLMDRRVSELAYGQRRQVEIALALALKPKVLLLDEPVAGVPSTEGRRIFDVLERLPDDVAVLVIEHDMDLVFRFARRITVLVEGQVLTEGPVNDIRSDSRVRDVYLGKHGAKEHAHA
jgi:branched-chain amino acid transport system ATP-binding protein